MTQPFDDESSFLSYNDHERCFYEHTTAWNQCSHGPCVMGVDLARTKDLSVFAVFEKLNDIYFLRALECLRNARFDEQEIVFEKLFTLYKIQNVCIDQTGIGRQFLERAQTHFGPHHIEGIQFTAKTKESLAYNFKAHLERYALRIPRDENLIKDLLSLRINDKSQINAQHSANGHADRFWAIALALNADKQHKSVQFSTEFFPITKHSIYEN